MISELKTTVSEEGFRIDIEERVEWALRKIAQLDADEERIKANAANILKDIETERNAFLHRFGRELEEYAETHPPKSGKTLKFLNGKLSYRTQPARLAVVDGPLALAHAWANPELKERCVEITPSLLKSEYIKAVEETGELLPGVEQTEAMEAFYINGHRLDRVPEPEGEEVHEDN